LKARLLPVLSEQIKQLFGQSVRSQLTSRSKKKAHLQYIEFQLLNFGRILVFSILERSLSDPRAGPFPCSLQGNAWREAKSGFENENENENENEK
jgi:hypothetical protein